MTIREMIQDYCYSCWSRPYWGDGPRIPWAQSPYARLPLKGESLMGLNMQFGDFTGVDFRGTNLKCTDLKWAILEGAILDEGTAVGGVVAGQAFPNICWWAVRLREGGVLFQFGGDRALLTEWEKRDPTYGARYGFPPAYWERIEEILALVKSKTEIP